VSTLKFSILERNNRATLKAATPNPLGVWGQFLAMRNGQMDNPCPPEVGLRMARLWDAIQASAAQKGQPVLCN
jgi:hypothetical protein